MPLGDLSLEAILSYEVLTNPENVEAHYDNQTHRDPDGVINLVVPKVDDSSGSRQFS